MGIKCFLIEPIFGAPYGDPNGPYAGWPPHKTILGWVRKDTGEQHANCSQFEVGAMWYACWLWKGAAWENETEPHLHVRTPGGDWDIDNRCSNCSLPQDNLHRCWVRHGEVPNITVDKHGVTCSAGAGSIALPRWHGFLRNGELVEA